MLSLANALATGDPSSRTYCEALADRIAGHAHLNAFTVFDRDALLAAADAADKARAQGKAVGPLHGVPLILKDNINTTALPTSAGTPALKGNISAANAPLAQRLFDAGALLAGKANLHELSSGCTCANEVFGPVRNPFDTARIPGGSSGGTAAAIAAGLVPAGLGTDTAGSVRVPASLCGIYGFRPSTGRYAAAGIVPLSQTVDTAGPMAASLDGILLLDSVMANDPKPVGAREAKGLRLGVAEDLIAASSAHVTGVMDAALKRLEDGGVTLVPVNLRPLDAARRAAAADLIDYEFPGMMRAYLAAHAPDVSLEQFVERIAAPATKQFTAERLTKKISDDAYRFAVGPAFDAYDAAYRKLLTDAQVDAVCFPTTPDIALPLVEDDTVLKDGAPVFSWFYYAHTAFASYGRRPGISIPAGLSSDGFPAGLEIDGLRGEDETLLGIARAVAPLVDVSREQ